MMNDLFRKTLVIFLGTHESGYIGDEELVIGVGGPCLLDTGLY